MEKLRCSKCLHATGSCRHTHYAPSVVGTLEGIPQADGNTGFDSPQKDRRGLPRPQSSRPSRRAPSIPLAVQTPGEEGQLRETIAIKSPAQDSSAGCKQCLSPACEVPGEWLIKDESQGQGQLLRWLAAGTLLSQLSAVSGEVGWFGGEGTAVGSSSLGLQGSSSEDTFLKGLSGRARFCIQLETQCCPQLPLPIIPCTGSSSSQRSWLLFAVIHSPVSFLPLHWAPQVYLPDKHRMPR